MALGCCRIRTENAQLAEVNRDLELEVARIKAVNVERITRIKVLQDENTTYVARIATLEESIKQEKEKQNFRKKRLHDLVNKLTEGSVRSLVFQHYATRMTNSISCKG
jgi:hypothetical protein